MLHKYVLNEIKPRKLFLVDSLGALLTALMLGFVLTNLESVFGMPQKVLYPLSAIALAYSIYSFWCYQRAKENCRPFLKAIAIANLAYCCATVGLVIYLRGQLTSLGLIYFSLEAMIIFGLAIIELKTASQLVSGKV